jgi:chromatin segregation and condensation protein Rec8/ScpA/Scc1 (kleisin family)
MILRISTALNHEASISFSRIRATCVGPQDTAVAFLAILTLMRRQVVIATQSELFGTIELARGQLATHSSDEPASWDLDGTDGDSRRRT